MDESKVLATIEKFRLALDNRGVKAERIVLFGSHARGDAREDSDIDIVVISRDFNRKGYWERHDVLVKALAEVWEPMDVFAKTPKEWRETDSLIVGFAKQDGKTVYPAA